MSRPDVATYQAGVAAAVSVARGAPAAGDLETLIRSIVREEVERALADRAPAAPELVTMAEFARARSISVSTVRTAIRQGRLQASKIPGRGASARAVRVRRDAEIARPAHAAPNRTAAASRRLGLHVTK